ncbi:hypothetical protein ACVBEQ_02250 [Nakamurella sp. GG22]
MAYLPDQDDPSPRLSTAIVLSTTEDDCTVVAADRRLTVPFAPPFPRPRVERVAPGHLVALARPTGGDAVVVWRWFDAVVLGASDSGITLWEPLHRSVLAVPRDPGRSYRVGSRAYASAGLPGADWWVAGPAVDRAEDADVDLDAVEQFFTELGLWASPA